MKFQENGERSRQGGTTVLGHYPAYTKLAGELGAKRLNIPTNVWNKMTSAQQWGVNLKFLDRMILRGDNIRLATPLNQVKPGSFYQKELNYLFDKGYKVSSDGLWLVKQKAMKNNEKIYSFLKSNGFELIQKDTSAFFGDYYDIFTNGSFQLRFSSSKSFETVDICSSKPNENWYDLALVKTLLYNEKNLTNVTIH